MEGLNRHPKKENAMPQYMFSVNHEVGEELPTGDDVQRMFTQVDAFN